MAGNEYLGVKHLDYPPTLASDYIMFLCTEVVSSKLAHPLIQRNNTKSCNL
jgi:hypothetical protein